MADANLSIKVNAENLASGHLKEVEESAGGLGEQLKSVAEIAEGIGLAELGEGIAEHFGEAITAVTSLGDATFKLSTNTGMSAESASAWISAFNKFGVEADTANKSLGIFEKNLENINNGASSSKSFSTSMTQLGLDVKNADGSIKDMSEVLLDVADKFKDMPDGPEKTAIAMNLFGKSGKDLIPVLDEGRDAIQEAMDDAKKYGLTLSGDNVEAVRNFGIAHRELDEAIEGVEVQIGTALMPILSSLLEALLNGAHAFNDNVMPAIHQFADYINANVVPVLEHLGEVIADTLQGGDRSFQEVFGSIGVVLDDFVMAVQSVAGVVQTALAGNFVGAVQQTEDDVVPILMNLSTDITENAADWAAGFIAWIAPMADPMIHQLGQVLTDLTGWMVDTALPAITAKLLEWGVAFVKWVAPLIPPLLLELGKLLLELGIWIVTTATPAIAAHLIKWGEAFLGFVKDDVLPFLADRLGEILNAIGAWITGTALPWVGSEVAKIGTAMIDAIQAGIHTAFQGFMGWLKANVLDAIPEGIKSILGLPNDTGVLAQVGERMVEEMEIGIKNRFPSLQSLMSKLFGAGSEISGNLADWISAAIAYTGVGSDWASGLGIVISHEDGSLDPRKANDWDVNAKNGDPSIGLMQLTGSNRSAYTPQGMDQYNPVAEIIAGINYIKSRYGTIDNVPGVRSVRSGQEYLPYDDGGMLPPGVSQVVNLTGKPEPVLTSDQWDLLRNGGTGPVEVRVFIGNKELEDLHVETHTRAVRRGRL